MRSDNMSEGQAYEFIAQNTKHITAPQIGRALYIASSAGTFHFSEGYVTFDGQFSAYIYV